MDDNTTVFEQRFNELIESGKAMSAMLEALPEMPAAVRFMSKAFASRWVEAWAAFQACATGADGTFDVMHLHGVIDTRDREIERLRNEVYEAENSISAMRDQIEFQRMAISHVPEDVFQASIRKAMDVGPAVTLKPVPSGPEPKHA